MVDPLLKHKFEDIKSKLSFAQVFKHYGYEWISNETHQLSCVFHARHKNNYGQPYEENPSARYYADGRKIWCWACNEGGDVIWFVKRAERFPNMQTACAFIEQVFGIKVDQLAWPEEPQIVQNRGSALARYLSDEVNDMLHTLRKDRRNCATLDKIVPFIFKLKWQIDKDVDTQPYSTTAQRYRGWRDHALRQMMDAVVKAR